MIHKIETHIRSYEVQGDAITGAGGNRMTPPIEEEKTMSDEFYGFDDEDFDGCEHGVGFDEECEDSEDDPIGCVFPGRCLMPGVHLESECHTVEMMQQMIEDGEA